MFKQSSLEKKILTKLEEVLDPELGVSIVALGLIYSVTISKEGVCKITMTLTTIGCPLFAQIQKEIEERVMKIEGIEDVDIELTFDPPWSPEKMTPNAKAQLGID